MTEEIIPTNGTSAEDVAYAKKVKEIYIDGVNVAGCFYFIDHTPPKGQGDWCGAIHKGACKVYSKDCEYNKDCYYKQLKRLEQENKELKELNKKICEDWEKEIKVYWNALEEIREIAKLNQFYNPKDLLINGDIGQLQNLKMTEIYNKINEVLNENQAN